MSHESTPDPTDLPEGTAEENPEREQTSMDAQLGTPEDPLVRTEEARRRPRPDAWAGRRRSYAGGEEDQAVEESGGGVSEGFEESERQLIEEASHGDGGGSPEVDAFTPEAESDEATAEYGEADEVEQPEARRASQRSNSVESTTSVTVG